MAHDLVVRVHEHKFGFIEGFTRQYRITRLVYFETFKHVKNCIDREKQVKAWTRAKRIALIESKNPTWEDLAADWFLPDGELNSNSRSLASLGMTNWRTKASVATVQGPGRVSKVAGGRP
jgi:putative endonuclease